MVWLKLRFTKLDSIKAKECNQTQQPQKLRFWKCPSLFIQAPLCVKKIAKTANNIYVDINFKVSTENYLDKDMYLEADIIPGEPCKLYFPWLTDYLSIFTFNVLLGKISKCPYENKHLFTVQADFFWS